MRFLIAITTLVLLLSQALPAQAPRPRDHEVKAVYLLNFGRFAKWPAPNRTATPPAFAVCVLGHDPFGSALDATVAGESIDGRPVVTKRLASASDAAGCRILFISASEDAQLKRILDLIRGTPTLTVSDIPRFAEQGGMIQFVSEGNRVRFSVNVAATEQAGLTLSSELLRVAVTVKGARPPGA